MEKRLVPCARTADGRVLPIDDDSWDDGITEEEADLLANLAESKTFPGLVAEHVAAAGKQACVKLRAAFSDQTPDRLSS